MADNNEKLKRKIKNKLRDIEDVLMELENINNNIENVKHSIGWGILGIIPIIALIIARNVNKGKYLQKIKNELPYYISNIKKIKEELKDLYEEDNIKEEDFEDILEKIENLKRKYISFINEYQNPPYYWLALLSFIPYIGFIFGIMVSSNKPLGEAYDKYYPKLRQIASYL